MVDYRNIDWRQERPSEASFETGWLKSHIFEIQKLDQRLEAVLKALERTLGDDNARVAQFQLDVDSDVAWFLTRNRLPETHFFTKFFSLGVVQRRMRIAPPVSTVIGLGFMLEGSFIAMGRLAECVSKGGPYLRFEGSDADVLQLVGGFTDAAFGNRFSDTAVYVSGKPWSPWFKAIAWDVSFFWLDKESGIATVLISTGTD
jgi:hypothetical protein